MAETAARLCKADLVTGMVGEFPELQGIMGGYYARAEGYPDAVADAIRDHYKPVGQGDDVPTAPVTVAVSLADKLDTIAGFFVEEMPPSGSRDPYALRRAALGIVRTIILNRMELPLLIATFVAAANVTFRNQVSPFDRILPTIGELQKLKATVGWKQIFDQLIVAATNQANADAELFTIKAKATAIDLLDFFADRLKVQQKEAGVRHDLIDAVFALGGEEDLVRLLARVQALQAFVETPEGINLLAGYKRAANILKKEAPAESAGAEYVMEPAEAELVAALDAVEPAAEAAVAAEDFAGAMAALSRLRGPIDAFFEGVTVNDADAGKRAARLALLGRIRAAVHRVADFSRIEG
ncbi:glycyl-tRNA synthetase beta chain [Sphingomonas prati]|uniref:Glycine--tRNA ligase beta subunit n=2 Tax=Sphingomonas prati TaxID=1843237 RepID=A0A7W9BSL8_9SPHN|nr:glycyl-tRNA synthetase beta chain [Sphingomonas prati]